ncbi:hypothetical protein MCEREM21A_02967 [Sphingomonadaceae bacterium]
MSEFNQLSSEVEGFSFPDYMSLLRAHSSGLIELGAASDFARQWLMADKSAPAFPRAMVHLHTLAIIIFPISWLVVAFVNGELIWGAMAVLVVPLYLFLRPLTVNAIGGPLTLVIWFGYACILANLVGWFGGWSMALGLTIIGPWLMNKFTYGFSRDTALKIALTSESGFVKLFKFGVLTLRTPGGNYISYRRKVTQ